MALIGIVASAPAAEEAPPKGVEVLARGPVHEAFAEPLTVNPRPNPIIHQKPPAPIEEMPPEDRPDGDSRSSHPSEGSVSGGAGPTLEVGSGQRRAHSVEELGFQRQLVEKPPPVRV